MDCSLPGSSVHGIFQTRILEWVAFPFSRRSSQSRDQTHSPVLQAESLPSQPTGKPQCWPIKISLEMFSIIQKFLKQLIRIYVSHSLNPQWNSLVKVPGSEFLFVSGGVSSSVNLQNTNQYIKVIVYTNNKLSKKGLINNSIYYSIKRIKCFGI